MKVALVHDHLTQNGGAERVLEAMQAIWPEAPTFTLLYDKERLGQTFGHREIRTSFLQNIPFAQKKTRWLLPLMPSATEAYDLSEFDVIVSSSSAFSKGVIAPNHALHISYCHTPTRYLWSDTHSYVEDLHAPKFIKRLLPPILSRLRTWDQLAAQRVDHFIANSDTVARRIEKYYKRESQVITPPVNTHEFSISERPKNYFLAGGRIVSYKRFDLIIYAFNNLNLPLKIFGIGPASQELQRKAGDNIEFLGRVSDDERARLFADSIAYIHPQEEDFGITPVESMAAGRPVIAYRKGGATETVIDHVTGVFFDHQEWESLADAVMHFDEKKFDSIAIRKHAQQYSLERFQKELKTDVVQKFQDFQRHHLGHLPS